MGEYKTDFTGADILSLVADLVAARRPFVLSIVVEARSATSARPETSRRKACLLVGKRSHPITLHMAGARVASDGGRST